MIYLYRGYFLDSIAKGHKKVIKTFGFVRSNLSVCSTVYVKKRPFLVLVKEVYSDDASVYSPLSVDCAEGVTRLEDGCYKVNC